MTSLIYQFFVNPAITNHQKLMTLHLNYTIYLTNKNAFIEEKGRRTDVTSINMITSENVKTNTINVMTLSNYVVNLSTVDLSEAEVKLLSKGLSFCPIPQKIDWIELKADLEDFSRRLRLKEWPRIIKLRFRPKSFQKEKFMDP